MTKAVVRGRAVRNAKSIARNAAKGMSIFTDVGMVSFAPRKYQSAGRSGDMERIGADMRRAFVQFNGQTRKVR